MVMSNFSGSDQKYADTIALNAGVRKVCWLDAYEIPALIQFAKRLKGYWRGIVSRVCWPMHTGQLEGTNNRIKVIKRMAYGYRDSEFFFMKIKSVFPGNP